MVHGERRTNRFHLTYLGKLLIAEDGQILDSLGVH